MEEQHITLSELCQALQNVVREVAPYPVWLVAELASVQEHRSGHCYLELVEYAEEDRRELAKMRAMIWRQSYAAVRRDFEEVSGKSLEAGMRVLMRAQPVFHPVYGLSLNVTAVDPSFTIGELEAERQRTIARLLSEGILHMNRELVLPELPRRLAVITSSGAAGYGDFSKHLAAVRDRFHLEVQLFEATMQGEEAPGAIISALDRIADQGERWDLVVIIRGGGSRLDLRCFDDYNLAAHVAQFPLPVLAGIGHERDVSVVDLVAHASHKTPTAVADAIAGIFETAEYTLQRQAEALSQSFRNGFQRLSRALEQHPRLLRLGVRNALAQAEREQNALRERIELLSPRRVLERGFALIWRGDDRIARAGDLRPGDPIRIRMHDGTLRARVE